MASIQMDIPLQAPAEHVWKALRDVGEVKALFPGVLAGSQLEGDSRVVTFANGMHVKERIVDIDEKARRVAYAVVEWLTTHHNASMQVVPDGEARSRLVWVTDLLPNELAPQVRGLMEQGAKAVQGVFASAR